MKSFIRSILLALWLYLGLSFALVLETQPRQPSEALAPRRPRTLLSRRAGSPPALAFSNATLTSKWFEGTNMVQIIEVIVENTDSTNWLESGDNFSIAVDSSSVTLVQSGTIRRLRPGDKTWIQIGVKNKSNVSPGSSCSVKIAATWGSSGSQRSTSTTVTGACGIGDYAATTTSLKLHQSPDWFDNAKYGIFFHWGLYSAPAYGYIQPNESYAEWYWNHQHSSTEKTRTYQYHLETYGKSFNYDDFISNFTGSKFDPKTWLDLIDNAGAQYFVPVTKHHDGFALFNFSESISKRSSVHYGPKRDFIGELLSAAKSSYPHLRRGTYFSLPEWYNPAYAKYAKLPSFPGGPPKNPYTNEVIDYTGYVDVKDFVTDIQLPQMKALAYNYDTEIMWCDIGGANNSTILLSAWLNWARNNGRQVTFNSRCGLKGDYDTPEYKTVANAAARKWEATRGMDPFSFGYNYMTPDDQYFTGYDIVQTLVDIVSKNGNFLLDIGPKNDGTIAEIMVTNLLDAGAWIKAHSESLFNTRYWLTTSGTGTLRYTTTDEAFYIHVLSAPNRTVAIHDPIPYLDGDKVTVVGGSKAGHVVPMTANADGSYTLTVGADVTSADKYVWTFKITY